MWNAHATAAIASTVTATTVPMMNRIFSTVSATPSTVDPSAIIQIWSRYTINLSNFHLFVFKSPISLNWNWNPILTRKQGLIPCASVEERNLLADTATIIDKNSKNHKRKDDLRKIVTDGLQSLGYDSSICKSKWEKSPSFPAGNYLPHSLE